MATVRPFHGIRPHPHNAAQAVSRPYDAYTAAEIRHILTTEPRSFLHVIKPEHGQPEQSPPNSPTLFAKSKARFMQFVQSDVLTVESTPAFYIYTQHSGSNSFTGFMACASVADYDSGVIRIHEKTIASREKLLKEYLNVCDINAEPVCFTYPRNQRIGELTEAAKQQPPLLDFVHDDGKRHQLWRITDFQDVTVFAAEFAQLPHIYIADGHHRSASSVLLAHDRRASAAADLPPTQPYDYFLGIFFPDDELKIFEYNRVVKNLGAHDGASLLNALREDFDISVHHNDPVHPDRPGTFGMYLDRTWYRLQFRHPRPTDVVDALDVSILSDRLLAPILGITDLRNDDRIGFVPGIKGTQTLQSLVDSGKYDLAFSLFPVTGKEFYAISDQGKTMPPKSTYVVPKLLNGLVIYSLGHG